VPRGGPPFPSACAMRECHREHPRGCPTRGRAAIETCDALDEGRHFAAGGAPACHPAAGFPPLNIYRLPKRRQQQRHCPQQFVDAVAATSMVFFRLQLPPACCLPRASPPSRRRRGDVRRHHVRLATGCPPPTPRRMLNPRRRRLPIDHFSANSIPASPTSFGCLRGPSSLHRPEKSRPHRRRRRDDRRHRVGPEAVFPLPTSRRRPTRRPS